MATDHVAIPKQVKGEILIETNTIDEMKDSSNPNVEETPCVTEKEKDLKPAKVEQADKQEAPAAELHVVEIEEKKTEIVKVEEVMAPNNETKGHTEDTKAETDVKPNIEVPLAELEEKKTNEENKEDENTYCLSLVENIVKEVEITTEKIQDSMVEISPPKETDEVVTKEVVTEKKEETSEEVADIAEKKEDKTNVVEEKKPVPLEDIVVIDKQDNVEEKKEDQSIVVEEKQTVPLDHIVVIDKHDKIVEKKEDQPTIVEVKQSVPLDETDMIEKQDTIEEKKEVEPLLVEEKPHGHVAATDVTRRQAETGEKNEKCPNESIKEKSTIIEKYVKEDETLKTEDHEVDVKKEEEKKFEAKENGAISETTGDHEKPALEPMKTESKTTNETKSRESTPIYEEDKTSPKQSNTLMGKVKKSLIKAKKAIFVGKNTTNTNKTPESKEDKDEKEKEKA